MYKQSKQKYIELKSFQHGGVLLSLDGIDNINTAANKKNVYLIIGAEPSEQHLKEFIENNEDAFVVSVILSDSHVGNEMIKFIADLHVVYADINNTENVSILFHIQNIKKIIFDWSTLKFVPHELKLPVINQIINSMSIGSELYLDLFHYDHIIRSYPKKFTFNELCEYPDYNLLCSTFTDFFGKPPNEFDESVYSQLYMMCDYDYWYLIIPSLIEIINFLQSSSKRRPFNDKLPENTFDKFYANICPNVITKINGNITLQMLTEWFTNISATNIPQEHYPLKNPQRNDNSFLIKIIKNN